MTTFIENFKTKARAKELTSADMLALCLHKTIKAKTEEKVPLLKHFIQKSFTPKGGTSWAAVHRSAYYLGALTRPMVSRDAEGKMTHKRSLMGLDLSEVFSINEIELFDELLNKLKTFPGEFA